jgi:hypothetical protein
MFWFLVTIVFLLTWIGARPVEEPYVITGHSYCISGLCITLRANIVLRGHRNYQFIFCHSLFRYRNCVLIMRRVRSG